MTVSQAVTHSEVCALNPTQNPTRLNKKSVFIGIIRLK
nr:MAG TPA: hypothetical protein [Caudoviricetes sp.]